MSQTIMYPAQPNSPLTTLAVGIDADDTSITVADASILLDAPNILVIGTEEDAETVLMTEKNTNTLTVTRGVQSTAKAWDSGTQIGRMFTAYDHDAFKSNIEDLDSRLNIPLTTKGDLYVYGSANARLPVGTDGQVLTADAAQALGVKWATPSASPGGGGGAGGSLYLYNNAWGGF